MIVSDIATRVKRQFGDEVGAQITDADIIRWVNDACIDIAINNNLLSYSATQSTPAASSEVSLPSDLLVLRSCYWNGEKLQSLTLEEADNLKITNPPVGFTGTPASYWISQQTSTAVKITLYPANTAQGSLKILYTRAPVAVTAVSDTPDLPIQYHPRIVEYCIAQAAESDDNLQQYQLKMAQYKQGIDNLKDNADIGENDYYPSISVSPRDYGDFGVYGE